MKKTEIQKLIRESINEMMTETAPPNFPKSLHDKLIKHYGETPKAYSTMWAIHNKKNEGDVRVNEMWAAWENKDVSEDHDPDQDERDDFDRKINRHNQSHPSRFPCPTCKTPNALSSWEKKQGYQYKDCADSEEGVFEHAEGDVNNPEEKREVEIGRLIKRIINTISPANNQQAKLTQIVALADELIQMHGLKELGGQIAGLKNRVMQEAPNEEWDVEDEEVTLNGQIYFVSAEFGWNEVSVDHEFDARRGYSGQGRDTLAEVPESVERVGAFDASERPVTDKAILDQLGELVLDKYVAGKSYSPRNQRPGQWM